ncbi:hypothetical protein D0X99_03145 [Algoriphagus lacus]|uniref:Lipoprotein n=1 Tax=Algoriphagus lacus TaxID=2056311 RepID=A0A418PXA2_9BACT|nr:hypothetical protein [Algoriphagus lacus]RIW18693.1 hypothetical protein D0X99_03145 [Algoriphagus lacus]
MKKHYLIFALLFLASCSNDHRYTLYSNDKKQSITIISDGNIRYIINGDCEEVPEKNYVKVDLSSTPMNNNDELVGRWKTNKYEWEIINDGVTVLENKLDSIRFKFGTKFPEDKNGIPTLIDFYNKPNCFDVGFEYNKILNMRGEVKIE